MLIIRFQRVGKKNRPHFRLVVTESKNAAKKKANEILGFYDPIKKDKSVDGERVKYWMSVGAQISPSAHNFLVREKVMNAHKIAVHKKSKKEPVSQPHGASAEIKANSAHESVNEKQQETGS